MEGGDERAKKSKKKQLEGEKGGERAVLKGKHECEKRRGRLVQQQEDVRESRKEGEEEIEIERERCSGSAE